jgi:hypothetical protein
MSITSFLRARLIQCFLLKYRFWHGYFAALPVNDHAVQSDYFNMKTKTQEIKKEQEVIGR